MISHTLKTTQPYPPAGSQNGSRANCCGNQDINSWPWASKVDGAIRPGMPVMKGTAVNGMFFLYSKNNVGKILNSTEEKTHMSYTFPPWQHTSHYLSVVYLTCTANMPIHQATIEINLFKKQKTPVSQHKMLEPTDLAPPWHTCWA